MKRIVLVVAKAPVPGRSKTRLVPPLTDEEAAALQEALLLDTLGGCRAEAPGTGLLYANPEEAPALARLVGSDVPLVLQEGRGLADALRLGMARQLDRGPAALVSSDVPGIPPGSLGRAFAALEDGHDVVLGPALDGGYWLIAMRAFADAPFDAIPWSTPAAYAVTLQRCEEAGLRVATIDPWRDVDTPVDLAVLLRQADELPAPRTARFLRSLSGVVPSEEAPSLGDSRLLTGTPWRAVIEDRLVSDGGRPTTYTYLAVPRAVFVVPVTDGGEVVFVRQYRHPVRDWTLEVPAGSVEDGETPLQAAERELAEETGGRAREWRHLTTFYSSSAHLSLRSDAFLATGVVLGEARASEGEQISVLRMTVSEALSQARAGLLVEGQTALAVLLSEPYLRGALA